MKTSHFAEAKGVLFIRYKYCGIPPLCMMVGEFCPPLYPLKTMKGRLTKAEWVKIDDAIRWHKIELAQGRWQSKEFVENLEMHRREWVEEVERERQNGIPF